MHDIMFDPAHGGTSPRGKSTPYGTRLSSGVLEKDVILDLGRRLTSTLGRYAGLTRTSDQNLSLAERRAAFTRSGASALVSLHAAPVGSPSRVWVHPRANVESRQLAHRLAAAVGPRAELSQADLAILEPDGLQPRAAAVLLEIAEDWLRGPGIQQITDRVAEGIEAYRGGAGGGVGVAPHAVPVIGVGVLQTGDVLMKVSDGSLTNKLIQAGQLILGPREHANITHAAIVGDVTHGEEPFVIESSGGGLLKHGLLTDNHAVEYFVFRCTDANVGHGAGTAATMLQQRAAVTRGFQYSQLGAVKSLIKGTPAMSFQAIDEMLNGFFAQNRDKSLFCSEFVLLALAIANEQVAIERHQTATHVPGSFFRPSNPSPSDLMARLLASRDFTQVGFLDGPR